MPSSVLDKSVVARSGGLPPPLQQVDMRVCCRRSFKPQRAGKDDLEEVQRIAPLLVQTPERDLSKLADALG